jgi:acyl-CoA synthetase (AMP-forming)/AMP-acid ligase II
MNIGAVTEAAGEGEANIASHLGRAAGERPQAVALKVPRGRDNSGEIDYLALTFRELAGEVAAWSDRLTAAGIRTGDRTLVMVPPGLPLIAAVFALFSRGAVPVVIDPGMGLRNFLACVRSARPRALVGVPIARLLSRALRSAFRSLEVRVGASGNLTGRLTARLPPDARAAAPPAIARQPEDLAAVLFTSGSTGAPKGVCYEHGMFAAQVRLIRATYAIEPGEIDLPLLPIFALFNPALGMTTIVPEINPRQPASLVPERIVQAIQQEHVTNSFGSPTLWRKIARHCRTHNIALPTLRRVLCAGAAVPADLWDDARFVLPHGRLHSPYGATEALPVSSVSSAEIDPSSVHGACVGYPVAEVQLRIIATVDQPIASLEFAPPLPVGGIGEITVRGPNVTKQYDALPDATAAAKIRDSADVATAPGSGPSSGAVGPTSTGVWHRMGDCGYLDASGRLWFCGRKAERVVTDHGTLYPEPCEQVFRLHPREARYALIGLGPKGRQIPAIVVEADVADSVQARAYARELRALALQHPHTATIRRFHFHPRFPVDVRHNAKIHRLALARWAATAVGYEIDSPP